jgi:hypothetical protein
MLDSLQNKAISLLADGVTHGEKSLYILISTTSDRLFFLDFSDLRPTDHKTIVDRILEIVDRFVNHRVHIVRIVPDNHQNHVR